MAVTSLKRQTIVVNPENWEKYCVLKAEHLRSFGKPEITFSEFVNANMIFTNLTLKTLLDLRQKRRKLENSS